MNSNENEGGKLQYRCQCCGYMRVGVYETSVDGLKICPNCFSKCNDAGCFVRVDKLQAIFKEELRRRVALAEAKYSREVKGGTWKGVADVLLEFKPERVQ
jgi:hypothetical protein